MSRYPYEVVVAAGCYGGAVAPVVSRHRSLTAAVAVARRSNRLAVERSYRSGVLYRAAPRQTACGYGCYGDPDPRPLSECVAEAEMAEVES